MTFFTENLQIFPRIRAGKCVHVQALGASCTEHFMVGTHWFDIVEVGFVNTFRRWTDDRKSVFTTQLCLNAGTSNHTTDELLARFDRDVTPFQPDLLILTCGLNDANPARHVPLDRFRDNLMTIREKVRNLNGEVLFQTTHAIDAEAMQKDYAEWAANVEPYMEAVREVAGPYLNDNLKRWTLLRRSNATLHRLLLRDKLHLNAEGNAVMGLDLARLLGLSLPDENLCHLKTALFAQKCLDLLEEAEATKYPSKCLQTTGE